MKQSVTNLLALGASALVLAACGVSTPAEFETGQVYCSAIGVDPENPDERYCSEINELLIARADGTLEGLTMSNNDIVFRTRHTLGDGVIIDGNDNEIPIKQSKANFAIGEEEDAEDQDWLVPANNNTARKLLELDKAFSKLGDDVQLPSDQPAYVDVPLCDIEIQFKNNTMGYRTPPCGHDITFFAANGRVIEILTDSIGEEQPLIWVGAGTWSTSNGVGRPDRQSSFTWGPSEDGSPISERRRDNPQRALFGQQRAYDPNVLETQLAYPFYDGALRDDVLEIYRTEIYPVMKRRELLLEYFPELED